VKDLVDLQGGAVAVESQLGEGSRFSFSLPVA
jgi:signal transduction histidine kinase